VAFSAGGDGGEGNVLTPSASLAVIAVFVQSSLLWSGYVTPLVLFPPGSFMTMAQGISLPYPQAALVHDR
jgi:DHA1 family bicyclomycin/chloramphenicol resistance-like MFS transporter